MKGNMKKNKLLLTGSLVALAAPISLVACQNKRFDAKRQKLKFSVTFSRGKEQWNALDGVIKVYNQEVVKNREALQKEIDNLKASKADKKLISQKEDELKTYMEVELIQDGSGYGSGHQNILSAMKNNDIVKLPNLTVNYGSTIAEIVSRNRGVNLSDEKYGDLKILRDTFEKRFTTNNDKIDGAKVGGFYSVPFLKSTVAFGINGPIYKYVLKTLQDAGFTISEDLATEFKLNTNDWQADIDVIKSEGYFGAPKETAEINKIFTDEKYPNKTIDQSYFNEFTKFIKFITDAIQIFASSSSDNSTVALLGIDDPSGILNTVMYSKVDGDDDKMSLKVTNDANGSITVGFDSLADTESVAYKNNAEVYALISEAIKKGALKIFGGGSYSSSEEVNHKIGANFGSTAGYKHNFVDAKSLNPSVKLLKSIDEKTKKPRAISSDDFGRATLSKGKKPQLKFKYANDFIKSTEETKATYYWKSADTASDSIYDILDATAKSANKDSIYFAKIDATNTQLIADLDKTYVGEGKLFTKLGTVEEYGKGKKSGTYVLYKTNSPLTATVKNDDYEAIVPTPATSLQRDELVAKYPPKKFNAESKLSTAFLQGPNLFVIDNGERQNKAALRFLKFVFDTSHKFNFGREQDGQESALGFISRTASYVIPYTGFADDTSLTNSKSFKENKYLSLSFDLFKNEDVVWYEEPTSKFANQFREAFNSKYKTESESIRDSGATPSAFDVFIASINKTVRNFNK
ncbi:P80 family lipoprotein [Mycoplasma sp. CSL7475-4]|uniref:P68 family surface lipoprotein n=1 Tax=Mycoplasma sp. CSL7475-4 TaxID=2973942 RepID=UPI00216B631F|nr:P80 family lipoprotein [Mycoplasma sp. CSL7475-4]MCS4537049.1 P80 family lipoprotein [Mycoplasma sp. CSL7475-4]